MSDSRIMVAVISDLHFEEEQADIVAGSTPDQDINLVRNIPSEVFRSMARDIFDMARRNDVGKVVFVLAGDVFDLHRTQLWFQGNTTVTPFVSCAHVTPALEKKLLEILDAIVREDRVKNSLQVLAELQGGAGGVACELRYIPGNHDRLVNATPELRKRVRQILNLPGDCAEFEHQLVFPDPPLLIRHGHEYDRYNFAGNLSKGPIPTTIKADIYGQPTFGDFMTVMIASRLPHCFRNLHGNTAKDPLLRMIYCRLLQFDDVRPQSRVVDFFLKTNPSGFPHAPKKRRDWQKHIWKKLEPVVRQLLDEATDNRFFMKQCAKLFPFSYNLLLRLRPWHFGIPLWALQVYAWLNKNSEDNAIGLAPLRETALAKGQVRFVAAGHTHHPQLVHLLTDSAGYKTFFTDTGTWRNAVLATEDGRSYGRVNATTYAVFYGAGPGGPLQTPVTRGFEFWSGFDQNWPVDMFDQ